MRDLKAAFLAGFVLIGLSGTKVQAQELSEEQVLACANLQMPELIDLMNPVDQNMLNCLPNLSTVVDKSKEMMSVVKDGVGKLEIGNQGSNELNGVVYNIAMKEIDLKGTVVAKHTAKVPDPSRPKMRWIEKTIKVPGLVWAEKKVRIPNPARPKFRQECKGPRWARICVPVPDGFEMMDKKVREQVPGLVDKRFKEQIPIAGEFEMMEQAVSATCKYTYTFNIMSTRSGGNMDCGQSGDLGMKFNFAAIADILNGQMPTFANILKAVDFKTPVVEDKSNDTYDEVLAKLVADHPTSKVYLASKPFVQWASVETLGAQVVTNIVTLGAGSSMTTQEIQGQLRGEFQTFLPWLSSVGTTIGLEEFLKLFADPTGLDLPNARITAKMMSVPVMWQKCVPGGACTPKVEEPRLGFAILVDNKQ